MFKKITQPGLVCIFDADLENPLKIWDKKTRYGVIKRTIADDIKGLVLEISSKTPLSNYINCPTNQNQTLGIHYSYFHMIVKLPSTTTFAFDIQVLDDKSVRRRFRVSTAQNFVEIHSFMCKLPLSVENGWNRITLPLHQLVKDIYGTGYVQTLRVAIYSNCILKKVYFSDKEYSQEDIPSKFHIEDSDPAENIRIKYAALGSQKRKNSLSYYQDLTNPNGKKLSLLSRTKIS